MRQLPAYQVSTITILFTSLRLKSLRFRPFWAGSHSRSVARAWSTSCMYSMRIRYYYTHSASCRNSAGLDSPPIEKIDRAFSHPPHRVESSIRAQYHRHHGTQQMQDSKHMTIPAIGHYGRCEPDGHGGKSFINTPRHVARSAKAHAALHRHGWTL